MDHPLRPLCRSKGSTPKARKCHTFRKTSEQTRGAEALAEFQNISEFTADRRANKMIK